MLCAIVRHDNIICNEADCPKMSAGSDCEYLWHSREFIQPVAVSAPKYVDFLMEWIEETINDHAQFPRLDHDDDAKDSQHDEQWNEWDHEQRGSGGKIKALEFPHHFRSLSSKMCRRMGRVYGHIYYAHWQDMVELKVAHFVNTSFQWFLYFVLEHNLVNEREFKPLRKVVKSLYTPPL